MWRTVLFTPGTRPDRVEKAWRTGAADVVVLDLEDAVPPAEKDRARAQAVALLGDVDEAACRRAVRVNALDTPAGVLDLDVIIPAMPDVLVVPKAEDADALAALAARIEREGGATQIMAIIETPRGVLDADQIAAVPGVRALAFGAEDLAAAAGMRRSPGNMEIAVPRAMVALACAAHGKTAVDMITAALDDLDRLRREAVEAAHLGYEGKMCVHPSQVAVVAQAMAPGEQEVAWARAVVAAADAAGAGAGGVVVVEGRMVDVPLVRQARRILATLEDP